MDGRLKHYSANLREMKKERGMKDSRKWNNNSASDARNFVAH